MSRFRAIGRKTAYLLPPSVEDWLPEGHLARFIVEAMVKLDLNDLTRAYAGRGSAAYHPEVTCHYRARAPPKVIGKLIKNMVYRWCCVSRVA